MAPLPNMERLKALGFSNNRLVAFVVATGPATQGAPWIEQWFFFNDQDGPKYGEYPAWLPNALTSTAASFLLDDEPLAKGRTPPGGRAAASLASDPPVLWQFLPLNSSAFGVYHGNSPAQDNPQAFYTQGLGNLLNGFGRDDLSGPISYVFGETRKKTDQNASGMSHAWIEGEGDCTSGGTESRKAVRFVVGPNDTVVGYAWSGWRKTVSSNEHRRFVHQFLKPGAMLGGARMESFGTDHASAQAFFNAIKGNIAVSDKVDYLYGCARVWMGCNPDQDDKPQDPATYPG